MEFVNEYELTPRFASVKSFYSKAHVKEFNNNGKDCFKLYSYNTLVCVIEKDVDTGNDKLYRLDCDGLYSATTLRHCKEFIKQIREDYRCSFYTELNKKDILKLPVWHE